MEINNYSREGLDFISIKNKNNFEVIFSSLGASIYSIIFEEDFLTLTPKDLSTFKLTPIYHGKTIGRIANRIGNGQIEINGKVYELDRNEDNKTLHGGYQGLSTKTFEPNILRSKNHTSISFLYCSKDGEGGFPGQVTFLVTYFVYEEENKIEVRYNAISNKDTIIALTNHTYFTLGEESCNDLLLQINADTFVHPSETDLIPLEDRPVTKVMDFRKPKRIAEDINDEYLLRSRTNGYDHHYNFITKDDKKVQISLESRKYLLQIYTDFRGCQIYTDNYDDNYSWYGTSNKGRRGVAIEPQESTLRRKILKEGSLYQRFISYVFTRKEEKIEEVETKAEGKIEKNK